MVSYTIFDKKNSDKSWFKEISNCKKQYNHIDINLFIFLLSISWLSILLNTYVVFSSGAVVLSSPLYAHCKMLEFKVGLFRSMMYDVQSNEERQEHHAKAAKIYGLDARKCNSCGKGHFLQVPSKEKFTEVK